MYKNRCLSIRIVQIFLIGTCLAILGFMSYDIKLPGYIYVSDEPIDIIEPEGTEPEIFLLCNNSKEQLSI